MHDQTSLEQRVAALELAVAEPQRQKANEPLRGGWLDQVIGSMSDQESFLEAVELGRALRAADRPSDGDEPESSPSRA